MEAGPAGGGGPQRRPHAHPSPVLLPGDLSEVLAGNPCPSGVLRGGEKVPACPLTPFTVALLARIWGLHTKLTRQGPFGSHPALLSCAWLSPAHPRPELSIKAAQFVSISLGNRFPHSGALSLSTFLPVSQGCPHQWRRGAGTCRD